MLRDTRIDLTCRPCSDASPTGKKRDRTWYLDAAGWLSRKPKPAAPCGKFDSAATISTADGAALLITVLASAGAAKGPTSPATAKNTAAGASTAARTAGDFRRFLANLCRPTQSTLRHNNEIINVG